jgi:hypothetical protein
MSFSRRIFTSAYSWTLWIYCTCFWLLSGPGSLSQVARPLAALPPHYMHQLIHAQKEVAALAPSSKSVVVAWLVAAAAERIARAVTD